MRRHTPDRLYVVACDKRGQPGTTLFMVDRARQRASFWSDRLVDVLVYSERGAAERRAAGLRFNRPRVLTLEQARSAAAANPCSSEDGGSWYDEGPEGWDGHKDWV